MLSLLDMVRRVQAVAEDINKAGKDLLNAVSQLEVAGVEFDNIRVPLHIRRTNVKQLTWYPMALWPHSLGSNEGFLGALKQVLEGQAASGTCHCYWMSTHTTAC